MARSRTRPNVDLGLMREMADAVDRDRGHDQSLLTRMLREAADEIRALRATVDDGTTCPNCGRPVDSL